MTKAWEFEFETMKRALPVVLEEEEQGWNVIELVERMENYFAQMKWSSVTPGSGAQEHIIIAAMQAMHNMGYDVSAAEDLIEEGIAAYKVENTALMARLAARVMYLLSRAPRDESHPHWKYAVYEDYESYHAKVLFPRYNYSVNGRDFEERTYGGWVAQICAAAAGTAVEGYMTDNIRKVFGEIDFYVRTPNTYNDDITYEYAFLMALAEKKKTVTSADIAEQWLALVPFGWSAEEIALKNLKLGIYPPESGYSSNPYREWIGAQMRGAVCGMVAPGDPEKAARYAFMDAVVSHHNNGVLGEIFNAVMVSLAYVENDVRKIVRMGIDMIPADSEYRAVIDFALAACERCDTWEPAWRACEERFKTYNWIHAYPNAAAEVIALWFGEGDFDRTVNICTMEGYDVDCNAAQIATIIGIIGKEKAVAPKWKEPIGDTLNTYMRDYKTISLRGLAAMTVDIARDVHD
jgi:ADP-ribosylglycohydrolase